MNRLTVLILSVLLSFSLSFSTIPVSFGLYNDLTSEQGEEQPLPSTGDDEDLSLSVSELGIYDSMLWVATSNGLGLTENYGNTWTLYFKEEGIADDVLLSVYPKDNYVICSARNEYYYRHGGDNFWYGAGISISDSMGYHWQTYGDAQGLDGVEGLNDIPWDVYMDDSGSIWIATWTDGLYRSQDYGDNWENIIPEEGTEDEVYHTYDIDSVSNTIWVGGEPHFLKGEINGVNINWTSFGRHTGLEGNFHPAIYVKDENTIWVSAVYNQFDNQGRLIGVYPYVYVTEDGGNTWKQSVVKDIFNNPYIIYSFVSIGDTIYGATTGKGIAYSDDMGDNWDFITMANGLPTNYITSLVYDEQEEVLWAGTSTGIAYSEDEGDTWTAIDYSRDFSGLDGLQSIVYPNPFHPDLTVGSYCIFKFELQTNHTVDLEIYDFAGNKVKTLIDSETRGPGEIEEIWFGGNEEREIVANGVYFYTIKLDGEIKSTGKVAVLK